MEKNNANYDSDERMVYAFLIAPLPVLILMWVITASAYMLDGFNLWGILFGFYVFVVGLLIAYVIEALLALPIFYVLRKLGIENIWVTVLLASLLAGGVYYGFDIFTLEPPSSASSFSYGGSGGAIIKDNVRTPYGFTVLRRTALFMAFLGAVSGLTFWKVYRRGYEA